MKKLFVTAVLLASTSAYAAELPVPTSYDWSGAYVGAHIGYGWGDGAYISPTDGQSAFPEPDGVLGGIHAGYNVHLNGPLVLGVEGDFSWHGADDLSQFGPNVFTDTVFDLQWSGSLRGRVGYGVGRFLPYITGGVAAGRLFYDVALIADPRVPAESFEETLVGWTIGAGLEYALTDALTTRVEYRYTDFGSHDGVGTVAFPHTVELKTHDVRIGFSYRF